MDERQPWRLTVDGEVFEIRERADLPGQYDFVWLTGPNPRYGFSSRSNLPRSRTAQELEASIRTFLSRVDPETGYIE